jgi:hypothetical protein
VNHIRGRFDQLSQLLLRDVVFHAQIIDFLTNVGLALFFVIKGNLFGIAWYVPLVRPLKRVEVLLDSCRLQGSHSNE